MGLAPWTQNEVWSYETRPDGKVIATVTGRERCPKEIQTWAWMLKNDYEQNLASAPWFEPDKPQAQREFDWGLRNPLQNARMFTWGWADRNYSVEVIDGRFDLPMLVQRDDIGEIGWQRCKLTLLDGSDSKTFTSYCSPKLLWYAGTQPSGILGVKFVPRFFT